MASSYGGYGKYGSYGRLQQVWRLWQKILNYYYLVASLLSARHLFLEIVNIMHAYI